MEKKFRILYVDDEPRNLQIFRGTFEKEFDIAIADSPILAIDTVKNNHFEVVIADQRMPEMNGVDFLERINALDDSCVRVLLTGFSDSQAIVDAINRGKIFYYCTKPWKKDELKLILLKSIEHYLLIRGKKDLIHKLSESVKELEVFLYRASHDLKAPIATQLGLLNLLKTEIHGNAKIYVGKIEEVIGRLKHTLEKIEQLSFRTRGFVERELSSNIDQIIKRSTNKFKKEIANRGIRVESELVENEGHYFDGLTVQIIVDNLIENAIEFSRIETDSYIKINSSSLNACGQLIVSIEDNGVGIPNALLDKIYDPFFRGSTRSTGNGLGLYIVKKLCVTANIEIKAESNAGSWTRFTIVIPNTEREIRKVT